LQQVQHAKDHRTLAGRQGCNGHGHIGRDLHMVESFNSSLGPYRRLNRLSGNR
jgi:hypothetical protein